MVHEYFVYILSSLSQRLYIGVTNNLEHRVYQHKQGLTPGFTSEYKINRLVYIRDVFAHWRCDRS